MCCLQEGRHHRAKLPGHPDLPLLVPVPQLQVGAILQDRPAEPRLRHGQGHAEALRAVESAGGGGRGHGGRQEGGGGGERHEGEHLGCDVDACASAHAMTAPSADERCQEKKRCCFFAGLGEPHAGQQARDGRAGGVGRGAGAQRTEAEGRHQRRHRARDGGRQDGGGREVTRALRLSHLQGRPHATRPNRSGRNFPHSQGADGDGGRGQDGARAGAQAEGVRAAAG